MWRGWIRPPAAFFLGTASCAEGVVASRDGGGHGLDVCGVGTEEVSNALCEKETWRNKAKNESQEERKFSSSDSHFFLKQKKCESLEKKPRVSRFCLFC